MHCTKCFSSIIQSKSAAAFLLFVRPFRNALCIALLMAAVKCCDWYFFRMMRNFVRRSSVSARTFLMSLWYKSTHLLKYCSIKISAFSSLSACHGFLSSLFQQRSSVLAEALTGSVRFVRSSYHQTNLILLFPYCL